jgi:hypothetical protein
MKETASGSLRVVGKTTLKNAGCDDKAVVMQPFIVGSKNTPANVELGGAVVGVDVLCSKFDFWSYPKSGSPLKSLKATLGHTSGQSVSIAP